MAVESAIALSMRKTAVVALKENRENVFSDLLKITTFLRLYPQDMGNP